MTARNILITGVSRGLGRALCVEFDQLGHHVAGCARAASAVKELGEQLDARHHFSNVDLTDDDAVARWIDNVVTNWGTPDLVINNAASINQNAALWDVPLDEFKQLMDINITGVFSVIRHITPHLVKQGHGIIANLSSGWGRSVSADVAPYCASKFAIEGMTMALAQDLPDGLAAVAVNPGIINTEMLQSCFGPSAKDAPSPEQWAKRAAPFYLNIKPTDTGTPMSV